jgi:hypothetical protein
MLWTAQFPLSSLVFYGQHLTNILKKTEKPFAYKLN